MLKIEIPNFGDGTPEVVEYDDATNAETVLFTGTLDQCKAALAAEIAKRSKVTAYTWDPSAGVVDNKNSIITPVSDFVRENPSEPKP